MSILFGDILAILKGIWTLLLTKSPRYQPDRKTADNVHLRTCGDRYQQSTFNKMLWSNLVNTIYIILQISLSPTKGVQQHSPTKCVFKACVRYFSLFLKDKCISSLFRTKYIENKFNLQLFFLPTVSRKFILSWATTCYPPPWNFLFRKNKGMCNRDNARAACTDE